MIGDLHGATVTATGPVMVQEDGAMTAVPAPWHGDYTPAVNDRVMVAPYRGALAIVCKEVAG